MGFGDFGLKKLGGEEVEAGNGRLLAASHGRQNRRHTGLGRIGVGVYGHIIGAVLVNGRKLHLRQPNVPVAPCQFPPL